MFYVNLRLSQDSGELETLILGTRIITNDFLFVNVFDTKFFGVIPFMSGYWPRDFEVSFEKAKMVVSNPFINSLYFCPLSL